MARKSPVIKEASSDELEAFAEEIEQSDFDIYKWVREYANPKMLKNKIDYAGHPTLSLEELTRMYLGNTLLCLDQVLATPTTWRVVYQHTLDIMKYKCNDQKYRLAKIRFKIHQEDTKIHQLIVPHFISNMILWYAFVINDAVDILDESFIFDFIDKHQKHINEYIDTKIIGELGAEAANSAIDEIAFNITAISKAFLPIFGQGISSIDIIEASEVFPEIDEIIHTTIPDGMQPQDIEAYLGAKTERLIEIFCSYESSLRPLFKGGNNLSKTQFKEIAVGIGLKSSLNGTLIPHIISHNIMVDGICDPASFMTIAFSGRKAAILSKIEMKGPGAFSKKTIANSAKVRLRADYEVCDTNMFVRYDIPDAETLKLLNGRYYYDDDGEMKCVDGFKDTHLIGKSFNFRSPAGCSSKEGVCCACYGKMFELNKQLVSVGAYAGLIETEYLGQGVLSTKHDQTTKSQQICFSEEFDREFELSCTDIYLKDNAEYNEELFIVLDEIFKESGEDNSFDYFVYGFGIIDSNDKALYRIVEQNGNRIYLSKDLVAQFKTSISKEEAIIPFSAVEDIPIFSIEMQSVESTEATKQMHKLLDTKDHAGHSDISELCNAVGQFKVSHGVNIDFVHHEVLIKSLLRKKSNIYKEPDFGPNGDNDDYQILSVGGALYDNPSPLVSLRYGYLRKALMSPQLYSPDKTAVSDIDPLFAKNLIDIMP